MKHNFFWKVDETCISGFETFEQAVRELDQAPTKVEITLGEKTLLIPKDEISIVPADE
jgi:hypothetical protein